MGDQPPIPAPVDTSISGVLNRTFKIYGKHFLVFLTLVAIIQVPLSIANIGVAYWVVQQTTAMPLLKNPPSAEEMTPEQAQEIIDEAGQLAGSLVVWMGLQIIAAYATLLLVTAPLAYIASESYQGRSASIGQALGVVGKKLKVLIGSFTLYGIILVTLNVALCFILYACGLGAGLVVYVACAVSFFLVPIVMIEDKSVMVSLGRSWRLGKRRLWVLVGFWFATATIAFFLGFLFGPIVGLIPNILIGPILPLTSTILYHDTRAKFEPNGVEVAADARLLTNDDILNLAILCVGSLVIALVIGGLWYASGGAGMLGSR